MQASLAVKHRPRRFADVAGQPHVVAVLRAAATTRQPPHQLLLSGCSGTGKTTLARLFAAALFCPATSSTGDACGQCESCLQVTGPGGAHPDVIELDAASHGGIDQIRELASSAHIAPALAPWKLYIIDEAHGLTAAGSQAALRLIEEPPPQTLFALATTDPDKLPVALRGRCLQLEVLPPTREQVVTNLRRIVTTEGWSVPDDVLTALVDSADPQLGVRGTVMALEKAAALLRTSTDPAAVHAALGIVDPTITARLTRAIASQDSTTALDALYASQATSSDTTMRALLTAWAERTLHERVGANEPVEQASHWLHVLLHPTASLPLDITRMSALPISADTTALTARIAHLEDQVAELASAPPAPAHPPSTHPAAVTVSPAAAHEPAVPSPPVPAARPDPTQLGAPTSISDPDLFPLINALARADSKCAILVRRAQIFRRDNHWSVLIAPDDVARAHSLGLAATIERIAAPTGASITVIL